MMSRIYEDIIKTKDTYSEDGFAYLYIQRLNENIEKFIGNKANADLTSIVYGYSVGFKELYSPFLPRIIDWLRQGILNKEYFNDIRTHQLTLSNALAFAHWIYTGNNDILLWKKAIYWRDQLLQDVDYSKGFDSESKENLALDILRYIQAKEYDRAIKHYEWATRGEVFQFSSHLNNYNLAYAYCLHFAEGQFSVEELEKAGRAFLKRQLKELYLMGRPTEMLYWLKTMCDARDKEYTPEEVIYTFYEFLEDKDKPDFIKELLENR
ncbi:hypothetical protein F9B74_07090 [Pelistega sp. NLN82]|uniref:Uncharacterized protein n=1 Tax=Pelistega ratti TaxID=2652177 RepID=A0A6L9Y7B1_9BURK|nr:hypothetical protein [Pelistega ratti]NEN76085.1 hypothetical protein [Pelistega ratti]